MRSASAAAILVACLTADAHAAEITLTAASDDIAPRTVTVRVQRTDVKTEPVRHQVKLPGTTRIELEQGLWEIRLNEPGWWGEPVVVRGLDSATMRIWPAASITGRTSNVSDLRVPFRAVQDDGPSGEADCELHQDAWSCPIPIGTYDLRFGSKGFAPEWRFDVVVKAAGSELKDPLRFVAGASLSGTLETARGVKGSPENIEVTLSPAGNDASRRQLVTRSSAKGFFQFKGVPAGEYTVRAQRAEMITQSRRVNVVAGLAAELNAPLLLDKPKRLTVSVMPAQDPSAAPWRIRLLALDPLGKRWDTVTESAVASSGEWSHTRMLAGRYLVEVLRSTGDIWQKHELTVENEDVVLPLLVLPDRISGRITLGGRPLAASLAFGGENGPTLHSDEDGRFSGAIAPSTDEARAILVEADVPNIRRTVRGHPRRNDSGDLQLDLELPNTMLLGRTIAEDGSAVANAILTVSGPNVFEQTFSRKDGTFEIAGLDPGTYRLTADDADAQSPHATIELKADEPNEVELVLKKQVRVLGRMMMGSVPVIGARIYGLPRDGWGPTVPQADTDERSHFTLRLPPGTTMYDLIAIHPAFDVVLKRMAVPPPGKILHVETHQLGGTLVIEAPAARRPLLKHAGGEYVVSWIAREAGGTLEDGRLTIPRLEPGEYSVCLEQTCTSGYVPPHGTLTLSLP